MSDEEASRIWDHDIKTRLINLFIERPEDPYGMGTYIGFNKPMVGVSVEPVSQALLVARNYDGQVTLLGGGREFSDEFIDRGNVPMPCRIKTLFGYTFSVGWQRKIYKRTGVGHWIRFADLPKHEKIERVGFEDLDAFSESDMYAVGGHGDVWHFNGLTWQQMSFPSNIQLATVTCADEGKVYISGEGGSVWEGSKSSWKQVYKAGSSVPWNDAVWFADRLWLASDYQLRAWDGKHMSEVEYNGKPVPIYGHMDARDGLLAVASPWSVMTFDGKSWRTIVAPYLG